MLSHPLLAVTQNVQVSTLFFTRDPGLVPGPRRSTEEETVEVELIPTERTAAVPK